MDVSNYSLKVNRDLLNPNFDGYRLSLDAIPKYNVELDAAVEEMKLKENQYTLDHMRAFGMYNYLHLDQWYEDSVLFVDCKGRVLSLTVTLDTAIGKPREVYRIEDKLWHRKDCLCASLSLTSASWAALSDGSGRLFLLRTGKRGDSSHLKWEALLIEDMGKPFIIVHSVSHVHDGVHTLEVLLLRIQRDQQKTKGSEFSTSLEWITVSSTTGKGQENTYKVKKSKVLKGKMVPNYAAIEPRGKGLMVAAEQPFVFTHVDGQLVEPSKREPTEVLTTEPVYLWRQTPDDIAVIVRMPEGVTKDMVHFSLNRDYISIGVKGSAPFLEGQLFASVDPEASAWIIKNDKSLEVTLQKQVPDGSMWPELVMGNSGGKHVLSDEQVAKVNEGLRHLTPENMNSDPARDMPPCNSLELEDCDLFPEEGSNLTYFDGQTLKPTNVVNLGIHQFLFTVDVNPSEMPCLCLRHDVDALLWQPRPDQSDNLWEHIATFNALGYVQASKRERKFLTCAPNFSYASLCECLRRSFIYRQPQTLDTVLFNRKHGRQVGQVAKQQVDSLDVDKPILGFRATNERLYILTSSNLYVLKVNNN